MGKSSKKVDVAPVAPAQDNKSAKKGKRGAQELAVEKAVAVKKQKTEKNEALVTKKKLEAKTVKKKKDETSSSGSDDSSSESDDEPLKVKAVAKKGVITVEIQVKPVKQPVSDSSSDPDESSSDEEKPREKADSSDSSDTDDSSEEENGASKVVYASAPAPKKLDSDDSSYDDSSSADSDSEDEKKVVSAPAAPKKLAKHYESSESSSDSESSEDEPQVKAFTLKRPSLGTEGKGKNKAKAEDSGTEDESSNVPRRKKIKASAVADVGKAIAKKAQEDSSSEESSDESTDEDFLEDSSEESSNESSDEEPGTKTQAKKPVATDLKKSSSSDESSSEEESDSDEDESEEDKQFVPFKKPAAKVSKESSSSDESSEEESDEDESEDEKLSAAPKKPIVDLKKSSSSDESSSEEVSDSEEDESEEDKPSAPSKKISNGSKSSDSSEESSDKSDEESEEPLKDIDVETVHAASTITDLKQTKNSFEKSAPKTSITLPQQGSKTLFAGNLSYQIEQADVENFFKEVGQIASVRFASDPNGRFRGFGHVEFATAEEAQKALELNGLELVGRAIRLDLALERAAYTPKNRESTFQKGQAIECYTAFVRGFDSSLEQNAIRSALQEHFGHCGEITRLSIPKDYETGAVKGIAYIDFTDSNSLDQALELSGSDLGGYSLFVDKAKPRGDSTPQGNRSGGWDDNKLSGGRRGRGDRAGGRGASGGRGGRGRGFGTPNRMGFGATPTGKKTTFED